MDTYVVSMLAAFLQTNYLYFQSATHKKVDKTWKPPSDILLLLVKKPQGMQILQIVFSPMNFFRWMHKWLQCFHVIQENICFCRGNHISKYILSQLICTIAFIETMILILFGAKQSSPLVYIAWITGQKICVTWNSGKLDRSKNLTNWNSHTYASMRENLRQWKPRQWKSCNAVYIWLKSPSNLQTTYLVVSTKCECFIQLEIHHTLTSLCTVALLPNSCHILLKQF